MAPNAKTEEIKKVHTAVEDPAGAHSALKGEDHEKTRIPVLEVRSLAVAAVVAERKAELKRLLEANGYGSHIYNK